MGVRTWGKREPGLTSWRELDRSTTLSRVTPRLPRDTPMIMRQRYRTTSACPTLTTPPNDQGSCSAAGKCLRTSLKLRGERHVDDVRRADLRCSLARGCAGCSLAVRIYLHPTLLFPIAH